MIPVPDGKEVDPDGYTTMEKMRYQCLIFDHDDTTVNSTAKIHYPCFVEYMARAAGIHFAAACWCFDIPENEAYMRANADYFCKRVSDLERILL